MRFVSNLTSSTIVLKYNIATFSLGKRVVTKNKHSAAGFNTVSFIDNRLSYSYVPSSWNATYIITRGSIIVVVLLTGY